MDVMEVCRQLWGCRQHSDIPGQLLENFVKTPHGPYFYNLHPASPTRWAKQFGWPTFSPLVIHSKSQKKTLYFIWSKLKPIRNNLDKSLELKRAEEQSSLFEVEFYGYTSFERLQRLSGEHREALVWSPPGWRTQKQKKYQTRLETTLQKILFNLI